MAYRTGKLMKREQEFSEQYARAKNQRESIPLVKIKPPE
mgnify:CR=1 FL=1